MIMSIQRNWLKFYVTLLLGTVSIMSLADQAANSVTLYTPYTKVSVAPGESVDYEIDVINNSNEIQNAELSVTGMPRGWIYILKSGNYTVKQISILPGEKKSLALKVDVPYKVNKGNYQFQVLAAGLTSLPLVINIAEQGIYKTDFVAQQSNMQGNANLTYTFNTNLKNGTGDKQQYALISNAPRGWTVTFKFNYNAVTSVTIEPNSAQPLVIEVRPPERIEAGTYKIPVRAATNATSADLELEVVITGSFSMELTTPSGLLSTDLTAGGTKQLELKIINTGSSVLSDITPNASTPLNWNVSFDPQKIDKLQPGRVARMVAMITSDKKAIPGDYGTNIQVKTPETSSAISLRISVETPMLWGWIGVLVILAALGSVYYLFRKYGRR